MKKMKAKLLLISSFLLLCVFSAHAQDKKASYLSLSVGPSFATGDFGKAEAGDFDNWNNTAGFAKTGLAISLEGVSYFWSNLGLGANLTYSDHGRLNSSDVATLGNSYTDAFDVDESTVTTNSRYRQLTVLIGPYYNIPLGGKFSVDVHLLGGLLQSLSTPEVKVQLEDVSEFTQKSSTASAFAWKGGLGLHYALSDKLGLVLKADYLNSDGVKIDNENRSNNAGRLVTKQSMSWVNTSIGLTFAL